MMKRLLYILPIFAALLINACTENCSDCDFEPVNPKPPAEATRVLFHYLAADESRMNAPGVSNVEDMIKGATKENMNGGVIYVFQDLNDGKPPRLLCIFAGPDGHGRMAVMKEYDSDINSADKEVFKQALADARGMVESDSWVLGLGSHGMGWMPAALHGSLTRAAKFRLSGQPEVWTRDEYGWDNLVETRAVLQDGGSWMEMNDLVESIEDNAFEFVIGDLCFMGGIEFAYAMRNKAKYLIMSPAEVIIGGFPYDRIIKHIFADQPQLGDQGVSWEFYDYYLNHTNQYSRFATIALYDCSQLEAFADVMKEVVGNRLTQIDQMTRAEMNRLEHYDRYNKLTYFDIADFVHTLYPEGDATRAKFDTALERVVTYKKTTGQPLEGFVVPESWYSGMSTYVPTGDPSYTAFTDAYRDTEWYRAVYGVQ